MPASPLQTLAQSASLSASASAKPASMRASDAWIAAADLALRTLFAKPIASEKPVSQDKPLAFNQPALSQADKAHAGALMRVNHVGEICAQALYSGQAFATKNAALRAHFLKAAAEETQHLAWTNERLDELSARRSLLNPLWYAGAFAIGAAASRMGDAASLGFVVETERQVGAHLQSHLSDSPQALPPGDQPSRAIVQRMASDEAAHAHEAQNLGAAELPQAAKWAMRQAAKFMTRTAYHV